MYDWQLSCWFFSSVPQGYNSCQRENKYVQSAIEHLFFYLKCSNDLITNGTKVDIWQSTKEWITVSDWKLDPFLAMSICNVIIRIWER